VTGVVLQKPRKAYNSTEPEAILADNFVLFAEYFPKFADNFDI